LKEQSLQLNRTCLTMVEIKNRDMIALRSFITAQDGRPTDPTLIIVTIEHSNLNQKHLEVRFPVAATLGDLRHRIYQTTGTPSDDQILQLYQSDGQLATQIAPFDTDESTPLASMLATGYRVHCVDANPHSISSRGALEDTSLVQKFRLTEEEYDARSNTLRSWAKEQVKANPKFTLSSHAALQQAKAAHKKGLPLPPSFQLDQEGNVVPIDFDEGTVEHVAVGQRCQVSPGERRGCVAWVGQFLDKNKPGFWVGVQLDEPVGNNNGSLGEEQHFTTLPKHGCFARGTNVQVGDFPERSLWDSSDDEDEL
jgi:tubulin-folding cofactor B